MLDIARTIELVKGAIFDAEATWKNYLPEADDWQKTAFLLTGPLIVVAGVLGYVIGLVGSGSSVFGFRPTLTYTLAGIIMSAVAAVAVALIISTLAGMFGGKSSFARGLAATSLAFVPGYLGQALNWLPWIGTLVALGLFIYALVLLWRIIPIYLDVPDSKRTGHYILTLIATIVAMYLLSMLMRPMIGSAMPGMQDFSNVTSDGGSSAIGGGMFSNAMRQGELIAAAEESRYDPPADGELEEDQVEAFIRVMQRTDELINERGQRMRELAERAERDEEMSLSEMSEMMAGVTQIAGLNTIEIEVVMSSGGNWAEHHWVKESLRTAYVQRDTSDAVEHNYTLYQKYEDELQSFINR